MPQASTTQKVVFRTGGTSVVYFNSRESWHDLSWPARGAAFELTERAGGLTLGHIDVDWGLFHLLDEARIDKMSDAEDYLRATWVTDTGGRVNADFKPLTLWRPFRGLRAPHAVVPGAGGCGR